MKLTKKQKQQIESEFSIWQANQYAGKDKKERQKFAQFFTPPELTIKMLEKFDSITDKDILDPTVGAGGLLVAAIIAGANPSKIYGIELDPDIIKIARRRLLKYGVNPNQLRQGDALIDSSYEFEDKYDKTFAVVDQNETNILVTIVKDNIIFKEINFNAKVDNTRVQLKKLLNGLKAKKLKIIKI